MCVRFCKLGTSGFIIGVAVGFDRSDSILILKVLTRVRRGLLSWRLENELGAFSPPFLQALCCWAQPNWNQRSRKLSTHP
jgi:hypothetical protein